jgi:hypothetical protein
VEDDDGLDCGIEKGGVDNDRIAYFLMLSRLSQKTQATSGFSTCY